MLDFGRNIFREAKQSSFQLILVTELESSPLFTQNLRWTWDEGMLSRLRWDDGVLC